MSSLRTRNTSKEVKVWDPLVRFGHWIPVAALLVAYFTEEGALTLHARAGYVVGAVLVLRIVWGFIGTPHARFSDFLYSPGTALAYLRDLLRGRAKRYIGHSPAGGAMVFLLIISLAATAFSGLVVYAHEENAGPLAGYVAGESAAASTWTMFREARADEDEDDDEEEHEAREEFWEETHEFFANLTLFLVILHVGGVALASFVHRENLAKSMINGRKRA
ncbi:MAG: hypothetical protein MAG794_01795 [Gammaproteobacteria bacterium]|nr:hypothetical protein [Gammaproteobacteria bacterium]